MLRKRILFALIYTDGFFAQSRNFRLQKVGDLNWLKKNYQFNKIALSLDELIVINASRSKKSIAEFSKVVSEIAKDVFIPVTAGGGIRSLEDAHQLFINGADKIIINSSIYNDTTLVNSLVEKYGSQSVIASIDYKTSPKNEIEIFIENGERKIEKDAKEYLLQIEKLKVGEVYFNSIDRDGTGFGYDLDSLEKYKDSINVPLIIAGGAGNAQHLRDGLQNIAVSAVATANLFNFIGDGLENARKNLLEKNENLANWYVYN